MVDSFRYLRLTLDKLSFDQHTKDIEKRSHLRLPAMHKLKGLYASQYLLLLLYQIIVQSILLSCSTCFFKQKNIKV